MTFTAPEIAWRIGRGVTPTDVLGAAAKGRVLPSGTNWTEPGAVAWPSHRFAELQALTLAWRAIHSKEAKQ